MINPFEPLGISPTLSEDEVRRAYHEKARRVHPDQFPDGPEQDAATRKMILLNQAYEEAMALVKSRSVSPYLLTLPCEDAVELANRLLKRVRDFAEVEHYGKIDYTIARRALDQLDVDSAGLDLTDRNILETIIRQFHGGPVGLEVLAAAIGEDSGTIEDVYEPYLIKNGFIHRTPRGRVASEQAYRQLGLEHMLTDNK